MSGSVPTMSYGVDPNGFPIDLRRPFVRIPEGGIGTEYSLTSPLGARWYNYPSIWGGRVLDPDEAYRQFALAMHAGGWVYPNFATEKEAIEAAKRRSIAIGT